MEDIEDSRHLEQQKTIHDYRKRREEVLNRRKEDKHNRIATKDEQLQTVIELQVKITSYSYFIHTRSSTLYVVTQLVMVLKLS